MKNLLGNDGIRAVSLMLFAGLCTIGPVFATGSAETGPAGGEPLPMRYAVPGAAPQELEAAIAAVNEALLNDGVNIEVDVQYIPWDAWSQRTNIMLSTGEPFELIHVMENVLPSQTFAARGAFTPLNDLIEEHGPVLDRVFTDEEWDALRLAGEIYAVPARWQAHHGKGGTGGEVSVRLDLLREAGHEVPTTPAQLVEAAIDMQSLAQERYGETFYIWDHNLAYSDQWLLRTFDSWPFYVDFSEEIVMVTREGEVQAYYGSDEFRQVAEFQREIYELGLRHPDRLSLPPEQRSDTVAQGRMLFGCSTGGYAQEASAKREFPEAETLMFYLDPDRPIYEPLPVWNSNSVPATTDHPEAAIQFLNWLYGSKVNHDLFVYGIPGVHYTPIGDERMEQVKTDAGRAVYSHAGWQIQLIDFARWDVTASDTYVQYQKVPYDNVRYHDVVGFVFDKTPVNTEYANVLAERQATMWPIKFGVVPYDEYFEDAWAKLEAAGINRIVEEYQRQYDAWKSAQ